MQDHNDAPERAQILSFPRRRGRPKNIQKGTDTGTPELVMKRLMGETIEALDLCLERGIITSAQHWCGIHLRWLYTLRHGAPGVRALDPTHLGGCDIKVDDPLWRTARELEYHEAITLLAQSGHALLIMNLCIYNERPAFLSRLHGATFAQMKPRQRAILNVREGLDKLVTLWKRGKVETR